MQEKEFQWHVTPLSSITMSLKFSFFHRLESFFWLSNFGPGFSFRSTEFCNKFVDFAYLLNFVVQSPSWEANWFAASQEIPRISPNPKVHYCTHRRPPPVFILGQPNPVHIPTSHLLEIHPNIIHPSSPRSPQWSPSFRFPHQEPIHSPLHTHTLHMPSPSHSYRFYHLHFCTKYLSKALLLTTLCFS